MTLEIVCSCSRRMVPCGGDYYWCPVCDQPEEATKLKVKPEEKVDDEVLPDV